MTPSRTSSVRPVHRWETVVAIDFDKWACATYRANFPGVRVECGPVADYIDSLSYADVLLGGPPCQPFSDAGENEGESDERDCIPDFIAGVRRVKPRQFLMENVRGLLKEKHWPYFCRAIEQLKECGYAVQWKLLDAVGFGVPQFRERVWAWGIREDLHAAGMRHAWPMETHIWPPMPSPPLFGEMPLPGVTVGEALGLSSGMTDTKQNRTLRSVFEPSTTVAADDRRVLIQSHADPAQTIDRPSPTLRSGGDGHDGCCLRIIGGGRNDARGANGKFVRYERDITNEPCTTITGTHLGLHKGAQNPRVQMKFDHGVADPDFPSPTIKAGGNYDASGKQGGGCPPVVLWHWSDAMLAKQPPIDLDKPSPTVIKNWHKGTPYGCLKWKQTTDGLWIRRLHPLECARLQSVSDCFVWPDDLPKTHAYKVIGNGWASRMGGVFSEAISSVDPEARTVTDLFCGGGLGAVGWHGRSWTYQQREAVPA